MMSLPGFTVSTLNPQSGEPLDILGVWQPAGPSGLIAPGDPDNVGLVWSVDLPEDEQESAGLLLAQANRVRLAGLALPEAERSLRADMSVLHAADGSVSFSIGDAQDPDSPRTVLQLAVQVSAGERGVQVTTGDGEISYGLDDLANLFKLDLNEVNQAGQWMQRLSTQVQQTVNQASLVRTSVGGVLVCQSRLDWDGGLETWWPSGQDPFMIARHQASVASALATRREWMRFFLLVVSLSASLAPALAAGPFAPITLWTTWTYLSRLIEQFQRLSLERSLS